MKEQIMQVLAKHPKGLRLRYIGSYLNVWHVSLVKDISELEQAGLVEAVNVRDLANMQFYCVWKIK